MKKMIFVILAALSLMLAGCSGSGNKDTEIQSLPNNAFGASYYTYVDAETGVNYVVFVAGYKGGICPRYNADGTLYVSK